MSINSYLLNQNSIKVIICLLLFLTASLNISFAVAAKPVPAAPDVAAKSYILVDFDSGKVLAEKKADKKIEPASITKLMTAYVVYREISEDRLSLEEMVEVSEKAWRMGGSRMYLEVGSSVSVDMLLKGLVVQSGNDASVALAEHIAGTEEAFVQLMNQYAKELGMDKTHFVNSTGWPDKKHLTSARDIATLASAIIREFPEHYPRYSEKEFTYNDIKQYNRNKLLWSDNSVDGLKTGHTESAGYCLVSSAVRSDMRLISVVLGTKSKKARASVSQAILNYGFRFYESHTLYDEDEVISRPRIWKGESESLPVGLNKALSVTIQRGEYSKLDAIMDIDKDLEAPISKGQQVGVVKVLLEGKELEAVPLVALDSVDEGSLFQIIKDYFMRMLD